MYPWLEWGYPVIQWIQGLGDWLLAPMEIFTFMGTENFYLIVLPVLLWSIDVKLGFRAGVLLITSTSINNLLKLVFSWPRPYWINPEIQAYSTESTSFGLPSGHAQNAVTLWGRIIAATSRRWLQALLALIILFISLSRLYLGVHFPADVLVGWVFGTLLLYAFLRLEKPVGDWIQRIHLRSALLVCVGFSLAFLALGALILNLTAEQEIPAEWTQSPQVAVAAGETFDPRSYDSIVSGAGTLLGLTAGGVLLFRWNQFSAEGTLDKRVLRYLVGTATLGMIFFGLRILFPSDDSLLSIALRYVRYAITGFHVTYSAPRLFVALRLV
jgi:membrane-associated phospholipid phosphatase